MQCELEIEALGAGGDGVARHDGARVFVAGTLPGERVRVELGAAKSGDYHARLLTRLNDGAGRAAPPCEYFGDCGGCVAQHIAAGPYVAWKEAVVQDALAHRGVKDIPLSPLIACPPASRRRARLALARPGGAPVLGFRRRGGNEVVDIADCAVVLPALTALLAPLRSLAAALPGRLGDISLTQAPRGLDVILHGLTAPPALAVREQLAAFAAANGIARLSVESGPAGRRKARSRGRGAKRPPGEGASRLETISQPGAVEAGFGAAVVALPAGAFLQATAAGEAAISRLVLAGLELQSSGKKQRPAAVADLYAGVGGIGFTAAAAGARVAMFDGDEAMAAAAETAARSGRLAVTAVQRDLGRRPLGVAELKSFDAVIFDPPRAGARAQAAMLAASGVARIAAVSCNPASFARDARILLGGGYRLEAVTPIDQFLWSSHVELVAIFHRDPV